MPIKRSDKTPFQAPRKAVLNKNLDAGAKILYIYLYNQEGDSSYREYAEIFGVSIKTIGRWMKSLQEEKFIEVRLWKDGMNQRKDIFFGEVN